jgi:hypothetical protein
MFALGLLGELIIFTHAGGAKDYKVDRVIQYTDPVDTAAQAAPVSPVRSGEDSGIVSSLSG